MEIIVKNGTSTNLGLMAFWATFEKETLHKYIKWHNCEHMAERVSIPGFQNGRRYVVDGKPGRFLQFYETKTSSILGSKSYLDALNNPTPWTKEALTWFREPVRNIYELIGSSGNSGIFASPYLIALRFNLEAGKEDLLTIYSNQWLKNLCKIKNILRARLFQVDENISKIITSERKIYSGGPGRQRYLVFIEITQSFDQTINPIKTASSDLFKSSHGRCDEYIDHTWLDFSLDKS